MLTKLLLSALIIYCAACYVITLVPFTLCADENEKDNLRKACREAWQKSPLRVAMAALFVLLPLFLILIPLIMPFSAVRCYLEDRKEAAKLRKHSEYAFVWTSSNDLPTEVRQYFERHIPEFEELGFTLDGFYLMKPEPPDYYGMLLLNKSGTTLADIIYIHGNFYFGFCSILESSRVIDTSSVEEVSELACLADNPRLTATFVPGLTISAGYQRHQEKLAELYWTTNDRVLAFEADQLCDLLQYEGRVIGQELFQLGKRDAPPPTAILPPALPPTEEYPLFAKSDTSEAEIETCETLSL